MPFPVGCYPKSQKPLSVPFVGPLDGLTAGLTYVVDIKRRLLSSYTGPAFYARADRTGQPTMAIPFTPAGAWDTAALLSFAGSDSVYVYDVPIQYGSLPSLAQAIAADQPRVVNAGVLETDGMYFPASSASVLAAAYSDYTDFIGATQGQIIFRQRVPTSVNCRPFAATSGLACYSPYVGLAFFDYGSGARITDTFPPAADDVVADTSLEHYAHTGSVYVAGGLVVTGAQVNTQTSGAGHFEFGSNHNYWLSSLAMWNTCDATLAAARRAALA